MIISRGRGYVFVHIPKTGGTSLALMLEGKAMKDDILIGDTPKAQRRKGRLAKVRTVGRLWKHSTLSDVEGLVSREEMAELYVFTLVRNPWNRALSYYSWLKAQGFDHPSVRLAAQLPFDQFVMHPLIQGAFKAQPYASYVTDPDGRERCNRFLRLEQLEQDLALLEHDLGLRLGPVPHTNRSDRAGTYRDSYTPVTRQVIEKVAAEDIVRFGYEF